jgi:hypothetical protein
MPSPLLVALAAMPGAVSFSPPLDVPLAYVATETHNDAGVARSFRSERRLLFRKAANGFVAEVTLLGSDSGAEDDIAGMFAKALGAFEGRPVRIQLDRTGAVTAVENRDALWEQLCAAIAAMAPTGKAKHAQAIAGALRKLPAEARTAMLGSLVAPLIAGDEAALTPGSETAASIRTRPPAGAPITIPTTRRVTTAAGGLLAIDVRAEADIPASSGHAPAHLAIARDRLVDPRTGLVTRTEETRRIELDAGTVSVVQTTATLAKVL